ncbi:hypothetical protein L6164_003173 [Bauhinia variegata]|uniref:Uncharacterized protein n=1 Tax=Bauhinia variegata TaxID=167791 RepID=A0ACB9Q0L0_BAUVA|nr:hypothetical protein L6164_003173 [Bauhinia variegata]
MIEVKFLFWCFVTSLITNRKNDVFDPFSPISLAVAQGVQPDQIIFTDVAMKNEHIRQSALADLFLDTPLCNAHTTRTYILWASLPMITLPLEKMATRVDGSLCLATGLREEMIVSDMKKYEERAISLALNRPKLQAFTNKLKAIRMTCPLFETARWDALVPLDFQSSMHPKLQTAANQDKLWEKSGQDIFET